MLVVKSQILFCKRAGSVGVNAIKDYLKRVWLVAITTISRKIHNLHTIDVSLPYLNNLFGPFRV